MVRDVIDEGPYPSTRQVRVECKHGAYHGAFDAHGQVVLQVREGLFRIVGVNIRLSLVPSTAEAIFGVILVENVHSLVSPRRSPCSKHQVADIYHMEKFLRNLDYFHVRQVVVHLVHQMNSF